MTATPQTDAPGFVDRMRARHGWFDHVMRAQERYRDCKGDFFAAGVTYFTIFALFPLLMIGFAIVGFVLARQPGLLADLQDQIKQAVPGAPGDQLVILMENAIDSRASLGVIGLGTALFVGLSWMANLREALSAMWAQRGEPGPFVRTKLNDLLALMAAFLAILITVGLTAVGDRSVMRTVLAWVGIHDVFGLSALLTVVSLLVSVGISWLLFTVAISRLPRESLSSRSCVRAGLLTAVGFELFKQLGSVYLQAVARGPAGATFGPVLGLLVFAYITSRLILFATAWAATASENLAVGPVAPPEPALITTRELDHDGVGVGGALAAVALGALGAVGLSRLLRR